MGALLQAIHCKECKGNYLVGINCQDIRKVEGSSGTLGNDPYVAFGHGETKNAPEIREGDKVPCPNCNAECTVEDLHPVKED